MSELREALARRLASLFVASLKERVGPPDPVGFPSMSFYDMTALADEVIRQMEWTRESTVMDDAGLTPINDLTIAPDDWKAE